MTVILLRESILWLVTKCRCQAFMSSIIHCFSVGQLQTEKPRLWLMHEILNLRRIDNHVYECTKIPCLDCQHWQLLHWPQYNVRAVLKVILLGTVTSLTVLSEMATSRTRDIGQKAQARLQGYFWKMKSRISWTFFSQQISNDRMVSMTAEFFCINSALLRAFLTSVTRTYVAVLIQFQFNWLLPLRCTVRWYAVRIQIKALPAETRGMGPLDCT